MRWTKPRARSNGTVIAAGHRPDLTVDRRTLLKGMLATGTSAVALLGPVPAAALSSSSAVAFSYGVASGDPRPNGIILWTAIAPAEPGAYPVVWSISRTPDMRSVVEQGLLKTNAERSYTVKIDVHGLEPDTTYWYQFSVNGVASPIGRTRTTPPTHGAVAEVKIAAFTCSEFEWGYFNPYNDAAAIDDLNAIVFLGDYIYEYAPDDAAGVGVAYVTPALEFGSVAQVRPTLLQPTYDIVLLNDYRERYRIYRGDPDLQALTAKNPGIHIWDDHEFADNANQFGAFNHNPATQGPWSARKKAAIQAFYEWIPIREPIGQRFNDQGDPAPIYRIFDYGDLVRFIMLDTRIIGRDKSFETTSETASPLLYQVYSEPGPNLDYPLDTATADGVGPKRSMMGFTQEAWVDEQLASSEQIWQVIGNQILYRYGPTPDFGNSTAITDAERQATFALLDTLFGPGTGQQFAYLGSIGAPSPAEQDDWTGYPSAKARFLQSLLKAKNPVLITGDSHNSWASTIGSLQGPAAVEFGTSSVSSPGFEQTIVTVPAAAAAALYVDTSTRKSPFDKLAWADLSQRGYITLDITPARIQCDFHLVSTVFSTDYTTSVTSWQVLAGQKTVVPVV